MMQQMQQQQQPQPLPPQHHPSVVPVSSVTQEHWTTVLSDFRRSVSNLVLFMLEAIPMPWVFPMQTVPPAEAEASLPPQDHFEDPWMCFAPETDQPASRPPSPQPSEAEAAPEAALPPVPPFFSMEAVNEKPPKPKRAPRKKKADAAAMNAGSAAAAGAAAAESSYAR